MRSALVPSRWRSQSGVSLIEVLLMVLLSAAIVIPLTAWASLALRQRPVLVDQSSGIASVGLLSAQLSKDIAVAGSASVAGSPFSADTPYTFQDCFGGAGSGEVLLVLIRGGAEELTKIVYTEVLAGPEGDADTRAEVWRRTCDSATGLGTESRLLAEDLVPGSEATCPSSADGVACRLIEVRLSPVGADRPTVVRGARRVDAASLSGLITGNRVPVPKIAVLSVGDRRPYDVVFSARDSIDPDPGGKIVCYQWVFTTVASEESVGGDLGPEYVTVEDPAPGTDPAVDPPCPDRDGVTNETPGVPGPSGELTDQLRTVPTSGLYYAELTVTDDQGASATTYEALRIHPRDPVVDLRLESFPEGTARADSTVFEFAASWEDESEPAQQGGTYHPDGEIVEYRWDLVHVGEDGNPGRRLSLVRPDAAVWYSALPADMAGEVRVTLTVKDQRDVEKSESQTLILAPPTGDPIPTSWPVGTHPGITALGPGGAPGTLEGARIEWAPAPEVDRYIVEFRYTGAGCGTGELVSVPSGPDTFQPLLPSRCPVGSTTEVRVAVEHDGRLAPWSDWQSVPTANLTLHSAAAAPPPPPPPTEPPGDPEEGE